MPDEYKNLDIEAYVINLCNSEEEVSRAYEELAEFHKRKMTDVLRYMVYLVKFMRENNIVWGVGRGSSVASYVLFLIGVHRINSIQY